MKRAFPIWFLFLVALAAPAAAQSLDLTRARVPGGGGVSAGGQFTLFSTVAQPESAARVAGGSFTLDSGFLGVTLPSPIPTVYFPSGTVTVLEDAGAQTRVSYATFEPGDAGPPAQPATFQLANNNAALFSAAPAMDTNRTLTFTPAANASGSAAVTVVVRADGVNAATNTFSIVVTPVNDAPSVTLAGNQTVLEDAGAQTVSSFATFTAGPADESAQAPTHTLTADNPALFCAGPAIAANGTLTYTPAANANGSATITVVTSDGGGTVSGGVDRTTNTFTITVTAVNDVPSVAYAMNPVVVLEDAGAQTVSSFATFTAGPADESAQMPSYTLTASAPALFSSPPALAANGTLTFTPAPNANGSATVTVIATDGGGTANSGVDRSTNTFTITVTPVNDAPAAAYATNNVTVLEDAGAQSISGFATFTPGPADESAQTATYTLTADNAALFSVQTAIAANGTLTFTPAANANGSATVTVVVADTGATANGGVDRSTNTFTITLTAVNDAPTVTLAQSTVTVLEDAGAQSLAGFATFSTGPANESAQALAGYTVSHNNSALFSSAPALAANGTLTFTPAANANGSATITVIAQDNGGTTDGGGDRTTNTFTITVTAVNDAPSVVFSANPVVVAIDSGAQTVTGFATFSPGPSDEAAQTPAYTVTTDNAALFSAAPAIAANGTLTFTTATGVGGAATVTVVVQDTGGIANGGVDKATNTFTLSVLTFAGVADSYTLAEDATLTRAAAAGVLANDIGPMLRSVLVATTTNGALTLNLDGSFTYQPATNFFGTDHFTYLATNTADTSAVTIVTINVTPVNDAPSVTLAQGTVTVLEDSGASTTAGIATFSSGPANESAQSLVSYTVTVDNAALFGTTPAINNAGVLTFTPAANANGSATVTVVAQDSGGTTGGGVDKTTNTFTIAVTAVNDAPAVALAGNVTVLEDAGPQTRSGFVTSFSPGPANESAQTPTHQVSNDNSSLFSAAPAIATDGTLTFTPATNANGAATVVVITSDGGGTGNGGVDRTTNSFTITVTPVNDAPSVTFAQTTVTLLEDAGAQTVNAFATFAPGPANESVQALVGYTVSVDNSALFSAAPALNNAGVLTFTPATNANGSATVTVIAQDNGGTANGGVDRTTNTFVISVNAVNDPPAVTFAQATVTVLEDAGTQTLNAFATFLPGPANESAQTLVGYSVTVNNAALFSAAPALNNAGMLTFTPATNANGSATVTVVAQDNGNTVDGGVDRTTNSFAITVTPVNDAPGVTLAQGTVTVLEDAGAETRNAFAAFSPGPANEAAQTLVGYTVTVDNAALFSTAPAMANNGTLAFTAATNANGSATVTVVVRDDGGTADGGVDKSTNTFIIVVTAVNDTPVANNDSYTMNQGDVLTVAAAGVLANDTDVENNPLTATKLTNPAHGTVTFNASGGFIYTPDANFYGLDSFTYRALDASSNSAPATVSLTVLARPVITPPPGKQRVFSSAALRFSATNAPDLNAIRVSDPDSTALTLTLTVTNGTLGIAVTNGLTFPNGFTNTNTLVLTGLIANLNDALESLAYVSTTNFFGDDALVLVAQDEGGRTNRGNGVFEIQVVIPARGPSLDVPLNGYNNPGVGRTVTNATAVTLDTNLVQGVTYDPTNNVVRVQPVGGQDGATNRSTVTVLARYSDGTTELITVPVIIYNPLLTTTTNSNAYDATFTTPLFNLQTSLYEQKVRVQNNTPFDFTALRITATNLPATVTLQNATITNGGLPYIEHNLAVAAGSNVTLKLEYFSSDLRPFTPGLKLELLNQQRTNSAPTNTTMSAVSAKRGFSPDGAAKNYLKFPTELGRTYYVQYQDVAGPVWKTSPVTLRGTGFFLNWLDDGPPNTDTPPGPARFYRVVTDR